VEMGPGKNDEFPSAKTILNMGREEKKRNRDERGIKNGRACSMNEVSGPSSKPFFGVAQPINPGRLDEKRKRRRGRGHGGVPLRGHQRGGFFSTKGRSSSVKSSKKKKGGAKKVDDGLGKWPLRGRDFSGGSP